MKWYFTFLSIVGLLLSLSSCWEKNVSFSTASSDTIPMRYAQNIVIVRDSLFYQVDLTDPWHEGRILHSYILIDSANAPKTTDLPVSHGTTVIQTPLRHSVVFNTAHAFLLQMLGATDAIEGVADARYMQIPEIHRRIRQGKVADCGDSMAPDLEKIINIKADAVWLSPFEDSGGYGRIGEIGIPVIECADYMETSALGRAEWMRFYGLLVGKENEADSLFDIVEHSYLELASQAQAAGTGRSIITERLTGSTWYVPGGRSSKGRLIADANGQYAWSSDNHSGSLALSYETVLDKAGDADVWVFNYIGPEPFTYSRLESEFHGYTKMKSFSNQNVYYVNSMKVPYFEEVSFRPDWLLRDYVSILHPGLSNEALRYFKPLNTR